MNRFTLASFLAVAVLTGSAAQAARLSPDAQLAKVTVGRTAGAPTNCLWQRDIRSTQIIDKTAIVYETNNGTLYVNRPTSGAESLQNGLTMVTDTRTDQLCSVDTVRLTDLTTRVPSGWVGLGQFVPYPRPAKVS